MPLLSYLSFASGLLPLIAAIINFKNLNQVLKLIAAFLAISFIIDSLEWIYFLTHISIKNNYPSVKNNYPILYLSIISSFIFYTWIYFKSFYNILLKRFTLFAGLLGLLMCLFFIVKNSIWNYPTWGNTALSFFMITICLLYFNQVFTKQEFLHIEEQPLFWFNSGVLIYSSFNIFLYMLFTMFKFPNDLYVIHLVTNIISNLFFTIGSSCKPRKVA
jgi:hypothetical protein